MKLVTNILTKNPCYTAGRKITVKGLMIHSIGCPQPSAKVIMDSWNSPSHTDSCVHAIIDGNDGTVYQTLPWDHRGWHCGRGTNGSANGTHIGVEMCEPACIHYTSGANYTCSDKEAAKTVVKRTYASAVELFAYLCEKYNLDPLADGVIISHSEGAKRGIATNHADVEHLWTGLGLFTMDGFRKDIKAKMTGTTTTTAATGTSTTGTATTTAKNIEQTIWDYLYGQIGNAYGTAGLMGNLYAESGLKTTNLEDQYEQKLGYTDEAYTAAVDNGTYTNFAKDSAGYGLAQWTYSTRKAALLEYVKAKGTSIGDLTSQLQFLFKELGNNPYILSALKNATSVKAASDVILTKFEQPADQSDSMKNKRASYGQTYFDKYAKATSTETSTTDDTSYKVKVSISNLNIRKGPGTNYDTIGKCTGVGVFTIVETKNGWGRLKSGAGWISLNYCKKI